MGVAHSYCYELLIESVTICDACAANHVVRNPRPFLSTASNQNLEVGGSHGNEASSGHLIFCCFSVSVTKGNHCVVKQLHLFFQLNFSSNNELTIQIFNGDSC